MSAVALLVPPFAGTLEGWRGRESAGARWRRGGALAINNSAATSSSARGEADAGGAGARGRGSDSLKRQKFAHCSELSEGRKAPDR